MAEKKLLWLTGEKNPYTNQYEGALIDTDQVYDGVNLYDDSIRAWVKVPGNTKIVIPEKIIWDGEEYDSITDMDRYNLENYLDSLVGQEGQNFSDEYVSNEDYLIWGYNYNEFANLADWFTVKCYDYIENTNHKTITLDTDNNHGYNEENELEITDTYNLDYLQNNNTNFEYGGQGNHALLHKVIIDGDKDDNRILWHEWSQWSGSELDMGCLMSVEDVLKRLSGLYNKEVECWVSNLHPELEEITVWLGRENAENK